MNTNILIIGNGFDLYHDLPTKYIDFLSFAKNWSSFYSTYQDGQHNYQQGLTKRKLQIGILIICRILLIIIIQI